MRSVKGSEHWIWPVLLLAGVVAVTGCNSLGSNAPVTRKVGVIMKAVTGSTPVYANPYGMAEQAGTQAGSTISLSKVKLFVKKLELKSVSEDSLDFEAKKLVVVLPLDTTSVTLSTAQVPAGTYDKFEIHINKPSPQDSTLDRDLVQGAPDSLRYSMIINGMYNGQPFTYKSHHNFEIELELNPPLVVTDTTMSVNVRLLVKTTAWFHDRSGALLDPTDPANAVQIDQSIRRSFEAHEEHGDHEKGNGDHGNTDG